MHAGHICEAQQRRLQVLQQHLSIQNAASHESILSPCRAPALHSDTKVTKVSEAVALIPDSSVITVSQHMSSWGISARVILALHSCMLYQSPVQHPSLLAQQDHLGVFHYIIDCLDFMKI